MYGRCVGPRGRCWPPATALAGVPGSVSEAILALGIGSFLAEQLASVVPGKPFRVELQGHDCSRYRVARRPPQGADGLGGMSGDGALTISRQLDPAVVRPTAANGHTTAVRLAKAATCARTLYLPDWADAEELARGMEATLQLGGGYGLA